MRHINIMCMINVYSKILQIIIIFVLRLKTMVYLPRIAKRDKWFYVEQRSLLGCEHACPQYFIFCRVRQATLRNIPREFTVGGRILYGSGNVLRSDVEYIHHIYISPCIQENTRNRFYSQLISVPIYLYIWTSLHSQIRIKLYLSLLQRDHHEIKLILQYIE